ncbi:major facilitator superfamily domain-containing protein, partial [Umbelopsis sp. PMI_123]
SKPPFSRPTYRRRRSSFDATVYNAGTVPWIKEDEPAAEVQLPVDQNGLSLAQILLLTICMAGVQFTWTVELSYGTPYLLSLELSKELTALVWLAGPLSGLLVQPLIGAFSDKCTSRFGKRRPYIFVSGILTCLSMLGVAYAKDMADWIVVHGSYESEESQKAARRQWAIIICVSSFYFLDFTLNAVQAICRALILDIPPLWQQDRVNAWSARLSNTATVIGHFTGFMDLVNILPLFGDTQVKVFCVVAIIVFISTLTITCLTTKEKVQEPSSDDLDQPWYHTFAYIWEAFRFLPRPIQTLCNTQFFAWMGWFPFLFYSTEWVSEIYFQTHPTDENNPDEWARGTRAGSFAMLCYAITSVVTGVVLPMLVPKDGATKHSMFSITNIYTTGHVVSAIALLSSFYVETVTGATIVLTSMGIPWAIVLWIPFSLVGEYVSYEDERKKITAVLTPADYGTVNSPYSSSPLPKETDEQQNQDEFDAGLILGVHNMYIVFPQFAVAIIAALIFVAAGSVSPEDPEHKAKSGITYVLAFGGCMSMIAATVSRYIVRVMK